jgi:hypothetical protein
MGPSASETLIDMPKVAQMLDIGWHVSLFKNELGSYTAKARHGNHIVWENARDRIMDELQRRGVEYDVRQVALQSDWNKRGTVVTDDFTPEQALTRLAYKVHGEVI